MWCDTELYDIREVQGERGRGQLTPQLSSVGSESRRDSYTWESISRNGTGAAGGRWGGQSSLEESLTC